MKTRPKAFDCVEMKRRGAQRIYERTKDMTAEQEIAYWRERSRQFREEQGQLVAAFARHFGEIDSGDPNSSNNERIDTDLAKEYGRHDERSE
jgi:hypothetical protein